MVVKVFELSHFCGSEALKKGVIAASLYSQNKWLPAPEEFLYKLYSLARLQHLLKHYVHIAYDGYYVVGLMVVEARRNNTVFYVSELQSYRPGVGEKLLLTLDNSKYPEVFFMKKPGSGPSLMRYYNKLSRLHGWEHIRKNGNHYYYIRTPNLPLER